MSYALFRRVVVTLCVLSLSGCNSSPIVPKQNVVTPPAQARSPQSDQRPDDPVSLTDDQMRWLAREHVGVAKLYVITSGPSFVELPKLIALAQKVGPSDGLATQVAFVNLDNALQEYDRLAKQWPADAAKFNDMHRNRAFAFRGVADAEYRSLLFDPEVEAEINRLVASPLGLSAYKVQTRWLGFRIQQANLAKAGNKKAGAAALVASKQSTVEAEAALRPAPNSTSAGPSPSVVAAVLLGLVIFGVVTSGRSSQPSGCDGMGRWVPRYQDPAGPYVAPDYVPC